MKNKHIHRLTLAAMFLALGLVLPFLTGQIKGIGKMLLPMHIPALLCGLICGWRYGAVVGFVMPILRSMLFGMPLMFPSAVGMAFELATYGLVVGILYERAHRKTIVSLYGSLITAMITGRVAWGMVSVGLFGIKGDAFTIQAFIAGAFLDSVPGIVLHLILIPAIMTLLRRAKLLDNL